MINYAYHPSLICFQSNVVYFSRSFKRICLSFIFVGKKKKSPLWYFFFSTCSAFRRGKANLVPRVSLLPSPKADLVNKYVNKWSAHVQITGQWKKSSGFSNLSLLPSSFHFLVFVLLSCLYLLLSKHQHTLPLTSLHSRRAPPAFSLRGYQFLPSRGLER